VLYTPKRYGKITSSEYCMVKIAGRPQNLRYSKNSFSETGTD